MQQRTLWSTRFTKCDLFKIYNYFQNFTKIVYYQILSNLIKFYQIQIPDEPPIFCYAVYATEKDWTKAGNFYLYTQCLFPEFTPQNTIKI